MGSFSWLKADRLTKAANVSYGSPFKFLIPKEFGGGYIKDHYQDYGHLGVKSDGEPKYDMYELLAFWNSHIVKSFEEKTIYDSLNWTGKYEGVPIPLMKEIDEFTDKNRGYGIDIGCYDNQIKKLKFPLKLVSIKNKQSYEECEGISLGDSEQGWGSRPWEYYDEQKRRWKESSEARIKAEVEEKVKIEKDFLLTLFANIEDKSKVESGIELLLKSYSERIEKTIRERYARHE